MLILVILLGRVLLRRNFPKVKLNILSILFFSKIKKKILLTFSPFSEPLTYFLDIGGFVSCLTNDENRYYLLIDLKNILKRKNI